LSVDILIPNFNGREALELCLESIARYTPEPHRVIVYDDASTAPGELGYLAQARDEGLIDVLITSVRHGGHGHALNVLINGTGPLSGHVAVIDNDIQILRASWLAALLALAEDPAVIIVCDEKLSAGYCSRGYRPEMFLLWFGLLNMQAYHDGMAVDWALAEARRQDEPWRSKFAALYPPESNPAFQHYLATQWEYRADFNRERVVFDPGSVLWAKIKYDNPKQYRARELTPWLRASFRHWGHAQSWLDKANAETPQGRAMRKRIKLELEELRRG